MMIKSGYEFSGFAKWIAAFLVKIKLLDVVISVKVMGAKPKL